MLTMADADSGAAAELTRWSSTDLGKPCTSNVGAACTLPFRCSKLL